MKAKLKKVLQEAHDYYAGKAIDAEEAGKDPGDFFEKTDAIEAFMEEVENYF